MHLFEIRNYLSILTARQIIKQTKIKGYKYFIPYYSKEYYQKIKNILNEDETKIISFDETIYNSRNIFRYYLAEKILKKIFIKENFQEIYLCNTHLVEKHLYKIANKKNIKINFFEEGTNCYFDYFNKTIPQKYSKLKEVLFLSYKGIYLNNLKYSDIYLCFPEKYQYKNYKKINKIALEFEFLKNRKILENIFLTRPLSEDNIIEERIEIDLIVSYIKKNNLKKITFKSHPRESEVKRQKIKNILEKENIEVIYLKDSCPAEELIKFYDIKKIIGFETGALVYLSELYGIKADSLLKSAFEKSNDEFLKSFYEFYKENFKKINYV